MTAERSVLVFVLPFHLFVFPTCGFSGSAGLLPKDFHKPTASSSFHLPLVAKVSEVSGLSDDQTWTGSQQTLTAQGPQTLKTQITQLIILTNLLLLNFLFKKYLWLSFIPVKMLVIRLHTTASKHGQGGTWWTN